MSDHRAQPNGLEEQMGTSEEPYTPVLQDRVSTGERLGDTITLRRPIQPSNSMYSDGASFRYYLQRMH